MAKNERKNPIQKCAIKVEERVLIKGTYTQFWTCIMPGLYYVLCRSETVGTKWGPNERLSLE
ncbi:hypothetical protein J6TS7_63400 [Paenibacillus dendritiformis]|nr:hypothetical protein J6TS7_63400 [Paenibacillus dendritiformis]